MTTKPPQANYLTPVADTFETVVIPNARAFIRQSVFDGLEGRKPSNHNVAEVFTKMLNTRVIAGEGQSLWVLLQMYGMQCTAKKEPMNKEAKPEVFVPKAAEFVEGRLDEMQSTLKDRFDFAETLTRMLVSASGGKIVLTSMARYQQVHGHDDKTKLPRLR